MIKANSTINNYPNVPFYKSPTDTHCAQAAIRMGYEFFEPNKTWTWNELDELSGHREGVVTWNMRLYVETAKMGYDTIIYDPLDYQQILEDFESYNYEKFSPEHAKLNIEMSDVPQVMADAKLLIDNLDKLKLHQGSYSTEEYKALLDQGYLIYTWVDQCMYVDSKRGFWPHSILVYGYNDEGVMAHDPGGINEPQFQKPNILIEWDYFNKAIQMNEKGETGEIIAFKK